MAVNGKDTGPGSSMWFFEQVNLFRVFCPHKYSEYQSDHQLRSYVKNEFIYFLDDPASSIYLIAEGKVKIVYYTDEGDEVLKSVLVKGDVFGELSLLGEERRQDFAQSASNHTKICQLSLEQMHEMMKQDVSFALRINKLIGLRIRKLERRIDSLVFKDVRTRMMDFLNEMASEKGEKEGSGISVHHNLTHKDIADLTGTTRQTVTTLLNELRNEGKIDFSRRSITIYDKAILSPD